MAYTTEQIEEIKNKILNALEEVIDPELGIDIVNLGLVNRKFPLVIVKSCISKSRYANNITK